MNAPRPQLDLRQPCLRFGAAHSQIRWLRTRKTLKCIMQELLTLTIQPHNCLRNVISNEDRNNSQILVCYAPLRMELSNHKMEVGFLLQFLATSLNHCNF